MANKNNDVDINNVLDDILSEILTEKHPIKNKEETQKIKKKEKQKKNTGDFVWKPLDDKWTNKLLSNKFMIKDCVGDGNCQFRSIETALINAGHGTNNTNLRRVISRFVSSLPDTEVHDIINYYRIEKKDGEFVGDWDPFKVKNKRELIREIQKEGFSFQGDNITLSLLSRSIKTDFVIFDNRYNITDLSNPDSLHEKIIILYYLSTKNTGHYQTIALDSNGKVTTIFKRSKLPREVDMIIDKHNLFKNHINDICKGGECRLTLNNVIKELQARLQSVLSEIDKKIIIKLIRVWTENNEYFSKVKVKKMQDQAKSPRVQ